MLLIGLFLATVSASAQAQGYVGQDLYIITSPNGYGTPVSAGQGVIALGQYASTATASDGMTGHALLWLPPTGEVVDLQPAGFSASGANATDGHQQVGALYTLGNSQHAGLWSGTPESAVDLHPTALTGFEQSLAFGVGAGQQVGVGSGSGTGDSMHALLWNGTATSAVDLHPTGFTSSTAHGADGEEQVGSGQTGSNNHALLWSGTASSVVDLHPDSLTQTFTDSSAYGVGGGQQVGFLSNGPLSESHAALWSGSAASAVDLRPSDAKTAIAYATDGHIQVGYSTSLPPVFFSHARLWKGTADSAIDLNDLLPTYLTTSTAYSIDAAGNIYGLASESDGTLHAVQWLTQAANLANISTRAYVGTGDNVLIAGFIVNGTQDKPILIRGLGPSLGLPPANLPAVLEDPTLELHDSSGVIISTNDNWKDSQQAAIEATGVAPTDDAESAILSSLAPGAYTVILRGANETVGNGLVEFYDLDRSLDSRLPNISSRGLVQTGDDLLIGGFIVGGGEDGVVLVRAIGPSLTQAGVNGALADPVLELHDASGAVIGSNDDWKESQEADITATGIPPSSNSEAAILFTFAPGNYTAIVRGANNSTGVALVEAYQLPPNP